jgi:DNA-binding phage protein
MKARFTRWDVLDGLRTEEDRMAYLHAAYEEDPGDGSLMRVALFDVLRARNRPQADLTERVAHSSN